MSSNSYVGPHFLRMQDNTLSGYDLTLNDPFLRVGRVTQVHYPDSKSNFSQRFIEYDDREMDPAEAYPAVVQAWDSVGSPQDAEDYRV